MTEIDREHAGTEGGATMSPGGEWDVPAAARPAPDASSVVAVEEIAGIARIFDPRVNAVIHARRLPRELAAEAARLVADPGGSLKLVVDAGERMHEVLTQRLGGHPALAADIARWAGVVADLVDAELIGVRLARLDTAMCPRFHVDRVSVRVVVTYLGPGTELLAEEDVDRRRLAPHHGGLPDERSGLIRGGPARIRRAHAGHVVVMKGQLWPGDVGAAVHRSPGVTSPRLVLTLDPLG